MLIDYASGHVNQWLDAGIHDGMCPGIPRPLTPLVGAGNVDGALVEYILVIASLIAHEFPKFNGNLRHLLIKQSTGAF